MNRRGTALSRLGTARRSNLTALATLGALALLAALAVLSPVARAADDVDLLRRQGGKPFVYFLIDTSGSMALDPDDGWVPGSGDDPGSKMFQVKQALYDVLKGVEGVHFGLASFNQDRLMVRSKHWLYRADAPVDLGPFTYPSAAGEPWTFGRHVNASGEAGTCSSPLTFSSARQQLDRFPRLGVTGGQETVLWVENGGKTYRLGISLSGSSPGGLGSPVMVVEAEADEVKKCDPVEVAVHGTPTNVTFRRVRDFLMVESNGVPSGTDDDNCTGDETMAGIWPYTDVLAQNTCGSGSNAPHTGQGAETNTDSGDRPNPFFPGDDPPYDHDDLDRCCVSPGAPGVCKANPGPLDVCYNLRFPTALHPQFDELDKGDQIPLHWEVEYKDEFLRRLNPLHPGGPDFGIASYFQDEPDPVTGLLQLEDEQQRPLVAFGNSPLGRAINDFRCWYLGDDSNKCKGPAFDPGWEAVFRDNDLEYGCRVPYLIVISDGEDNSRGNNPTSDVANMFSKAGVRTFVFTFESTSQLQSIVQSGKGELILVENGEDLAERLREIIGFIQEESRIFASAAVPSVQATVADKIYLTNFTPLNGAGVWDGHVHAFLEPLPIDTLTRRPDFDHPNHLWDAGEVMLDQSPAPVAGDTSGVDLQLGTGVNERRVYYALEADPGDSGLASWPLNRRLFDRTTADLEEDDPIEPVEPDLWEGLGLSFDPDDPDEVREARKTAHEVIEKTLIQKAYNSPDTGSLTYILGDIFHSNPLVIGGPASTKYFILDAEVESGAGYRQFFLEHENRRKVLIAGANDGMFHAWDSGKARIVEFEDQFDIRRRAVRFDNGTGRELFAYIPRTLLPTVRDLALTPLNHRWGADAPAVAADVFVDPVHGGVPDPDEREWRTVIVGGLREGGSGYFALDVTYPDHLEDDFTGPVGDSDLQFDARIPTDQAVIPDCVDSTGGSCGTLSYPAPLWEFTDRIWDPVDRAWVPLNEDLALGNNLADLGETWATPDVGRIQVWENGSLVNKYVAVFGGGLDPDKGGNRGNFVYIVDMETAQVLYKRRVSGSTPGDTAAVDTDQDSYFDRVYFGTTAGLLYRIDLIDADATSDDDRYPTLVDTVVTGLNGRTYTVPRIESGSSTEPLWEPVAIFSTGGRPIYYPPSVLFVAKLGRWALGFGTGDRDALGFKSNHDGRFYTLVDDSDIEGVTLPLDESDLERIDVTEGTNPDLLTTGTPGERGWFLALDLEERLISPPFGLLGVTFFATFDPQIVNETCEVGPGCNQNPQCSLSGNSRVYIVNTTSADAFLVDVADQPTRFIEVTGFVTEPFANESGLTQLEGVDGTPEPPPDEADSEVCGGPVTDAQHNAMLEIMKLFPSVCNFSSQTIDMGFFMANMECERIVKVPICVIEKNWKELGE